MDNFPLDQTQDEYLENTVTLGATLFAADSGGKVGRVSDPGVVATISLNYKYNRETYNTSGLG